jgi:class I fructose-bisphosphate aldolase
VLILNGKQIRMARILSDQGRALIVPVDQALTSGPIPGLDRIGSVLDSLSDGGPDAVILHRGVVTSGTWSPRATPRFLLHLSGNTELDSAPHVKTLVASVQDAVRLGADGVSVHVSLGTGHDREALNDLGSVSSSCQEYGMPLLAMMYAYGEGRENDPGTLRHLARIGAELGADLIKIPAPKDVGALSTVLDGHLVPVLFAGGEAGSTPLRTLEMIEHAVSAGAAGACVGRNVFQAADPFRCAQALRDVIHGGTSARAAYERWVVEPETVFPIDPLGADAPR